jgi:hypothetical protein
MFSLVIICSDLRAGAVGGELGQAVESRQHRHLARGRPQSAHHQAKWQLRHARTQPSQIRL